MKQNFEASKGLAYEFEAAASARVTRTGLVITRSIHKTIHGGVYNDGSSWAVLTDGLQSAGDITTSYDAATGTLTVNHNWLPGQSLDIVPDARSGVIPAVFIPCRSTILNNSFTVRFLDPTTGQFYTGDPGTKMCLRFTKTYNGPVYFDESNGFDAMPWSEIDAGNIWIFGIMQRT